MLANEVFYISQMYLEQGGNVSKLQVDCIIGSKNMDVDGIETDGNLEAVMRVGEFVFTI